MAPGPVASKGLLPKQAALGSCRLRASNLRSVLLTKATSEQPNTSLALSRAPKPSSVMELSERLRPCTTAIAAVLPLLAPLPASAASNNSDLLQVASPWLAVIVGALAFAAAAPERLRSVQGSPSSLPTLKQSTALPIQQSADLCEQPVYATITAERVVAPGPTFHHSTTFSYDDGHQFVPFQAAIQEPDRVKPESAAEFATVEAEAAMQSNILDSDEVFATEAALPTSEVEGLIVEWTGPDAGEELNSASAEEKTLNGVAVSFVSEEDLQAADSALAEFAKGAATSETASPGVEAVAINTSTAMTEVEEMRMEYDAKLAALKATQNDSISAAGTAAAGDVTDKAEVLKRSYDAKLAALKETAAKKDADNRQLWEARFNVMQRIRASAQTMREERQAAQPSLSLVKLTAPALGLAKTAPKVVLASVLETFIAIWNWLKLTATRIAGQDSREQPGIAA